MRFSLPAVGIVFDLDVLEHGARAIELFMKHTDPKRLAYCLIASGDVQRPASEVVNSRFDYCVVVSGSEEARAYVRSVFAVVDLVGLAPRGRRVIEQPVLDRLDLTEDGQVDAEGRLVTEEWYRIEHDRCKSTGWGYAPRVVNYELSGELRAELENLRRPRASRGPSTKETPRSQRDVCAECGETLEKRASWWLGPTPSGVVKVGGSDLTGLFLYCEHCQKAICGGCSVDLGMSAGCPFCRKEATELTHQEIEELLQRS